MNRLAAFLIAAVFVAASVGWLLYRDGLDRLAERGRADISLAADRVTAQLFRYRELAVVLARHPDLRALLSGANVKPTALDVVQSMADMTGAADVAVVDLAGRIVAGSEGSAMARNPQDPPLARALTGALGTHNEVTSTARGPSRFFLFAAPVQNEAGQVIGAVMTRMAVSQIEDNWPGDAPPVLFTDADGRVFLTNRSDFILADRTRGFDWIDARAVAGHEIWTLDGPRYLPSNAMRLTREMAAVGLTAELLEDTSGVTARAISGAMIAVGALMAFGGILFVVQQNRRALADRLNLEAAANARLEARVAERTEALKRAQDDLVQAGKLSALGQMSAGISHELNQPLMAIRSFAENAALFLERGKPDAARDNMGRISDLSRRMGRIIQNLRAFARQESGPVTDVDLTAVIDAAREVLADKISRDGVEFDYVAPPGPVMVRGGEVRLQQVVVNLVSNAVDAMSESAHRRVTLSLEPTAETVRLTVADTGPGIADPDRVFDPFYTTKEVGSTEGMGLGLSISYGLVQSFGGAIRGTNLPEGGAAFTVDLVPAGLEAAA